MMINILGFSRQLLQHTGIFPFRHLSGRTAVTMAEGAIHIANIGKFHINTRIHLAPPFVLFIEESRADSRMIPCEPHKVPDGLYPDGMLRSKYKAVLSS